MTQPITYFDDFDGPNQYRFLSNFYMKPVRFEGVVYPSTEHAFQAAKSLVDRERHLIKRQSTAGKAKRIGQQVTLDPMWETRKILVMHTLLKRKFQYGSELAAWLVDTGDAMLIEGNTWHDQFWGDCECPKHKAQAGENWLGRLLMLVRRDLIEQHRQEEDQGR